VSEQNKNTKQRPGSPDGKKPSGIRTSRSTGEKNLKTAYILMTVIVVLLIFLMILIPEKKPTGAENGSTGAYPGSTGEDFYGSDQSAGGDTSSWGAGGPAERQDSTEQGGEETGPSFKSDGQAEPSAEKGVLYLVIDDVGYNLEQLESFLSLPIPVTYAVLPQLDHTVSSYRRVLAAGQEVILHQPFEPVGDQDPGPGALFVGMKGEAVRDTLRQNLSQLPGAVGMNNHMGSKATADAELLKEVMLELQSRGRGFYFLDSKTTSESRVEEVAEEYSVLHSQRNIFLDNSRDPEDIRTALAAALDIAKTRGSVVMIGHVWCSELAAELSMWYENVQRQGYVFSHLSARFLKEALYAGSGG
jgi:hypothetical protein